MSIETLVTAGDIALALGLFPAFYFIIDYGFVRPLRGYVPWWRSSLGWAVVTVMSGLASTNALLLATIYFGFDFPGREIIRLICFSLSSAAAWWLAIAYAREKRSAVKRRVFLHHEDEQPERERV